MILNTFTFGEFGTDESMTEVTKALLAITAKFPKYYRSILDI